jgi:hypothetical protein
VSCGGEEVEIASPSEQTTLGTEEGTTRQLLSPRATANPLDVEECTTRRWWSSRATADPLDMEGDTRPRRRPCERAPPAAAVTALFKREAPLERRAQVRARAGERIGQGRGKVRTRCTGGVIDQEEQPDLRR